MGRNILHSTYLVLQQKGHLASAASAIHPVFRQAQTPHSCQLPPTWELDHHCLLLWLVELSHQTLVSRQSCVTLQVCIAALPPQEVVTRWMHPMTTLTNPPKDYIAPSGLPPSESLSTECQRDKSFPWGWCLKVRQSNCLPSHSGETEYQYLCG